MRDNGLLDEINAVLVAGMWVAEGREAEPAAGIIDSPSVKTTEAGGPCGYDAGKKIRGRKRHIAADTAGNLLDALVHSADIQDRDGAPALIERRTCGSYCLFTISDVEWPGLSHRDRISEKRWRSQFPFRRDYGKSYWGWFH
jgi:transposase